MRLLLAVGLNRNGQTQYVPHVKTTQPMEVLFPKGQPQAMGELPEVVHMATVLDFTNSAGVKSQNAVTVLHSLEAQRAALGRGQGRKDVATEELIEEIDDAISKCKGHMSSGTKFRAEVVAIGEANTTHTFMRSYTLKYPRHSRKYLRGVGAQSCPRRLRALVHQNVTDFDIVNCMFIILAQIVDRLQIRLPHPCTVFESIKTVARSRAEAARIVGECEAQAKHVLISFCKRQGFVNASVFPTRM